MKKYVIVVAGGKGLRMGGEIPKQFIPVKGKPVLMRTLETFHVCDPSIELIVVLPVEQRSYWEHLCAEYGFVLPHRIASGGETRFHSVKNGLALVEEDGVVGVHDGVRPFVSAGVIANCYAQAATLQAVVPVTDVVETVRHLLPEGGSETVSRNKNNLATITGYSGLSPMINSSTVNSTLGVDDKRGYPLARTYTLGLSINF